MPDIKLIHGKCEEVLPTLDKGSIDAVICDLPYGTTQCKWDSPIHLPTLWHTLGELRRDERVPVILTCAQPFTSTLLLSNAQYFKYEWVWEKSKATNYLNAKKQPLRAHESILVFYERQCYYNPQMVQGEAYNKGSAHRPTDVYGAQKEVLVASKDGLRYPRTVQYFKTAESEPRVEGLPLHPTQKPLALMEYLISTYTREGDTILDMCMGSGTTMVAAKKLKRSGIGIEMDVQYYNDTILRVGGVT